MNQLTLRRLLAGIVLSVTLPVLAEDLSGKYRVRGECAYRTENGDYKSCIAWNQLTLEKTSTKNEYKFNLETNTFATTQGSCDFEGNLRLEDQNGRRKLVRSGDIEDKCHFELEVTSKSLLLNVPKSEYEACQESCGLNSSLYSDPFPRKSRRK